MNHFDGLCLKEHKKGNGRTRNPMGGKTFLDLDYAFNLSILDESLSQINKLLEILRVQGARIGFEN